MEEKKYEQEFCFTFNNRGNLPVIWLFWFLYKKQKNNRKTKTLKKRIQRQACTTSSSQWQHLLHHFPFKYRHTPPLGCLPLVSVHPKGFTKTVNSIVSSRILSHSHVSDKHNRQASLCSLACYCQCSCSYHEQRCFTLRFFRIFWCRMSTKNKQRVQACEYPNDLERVIEWI